MASVFAAFIPTPNNTIKLFGVALTAAVLVDAFLIRLVFVPSFMSILGTANWWLPSWLATHLPHFEVEGGGDEITDDDPDALDPTRSSCVRRPTQRCADAGVDRGVATSLGNLEGPGRAAATLSPRALAR